MNSENPSFEQLFSELESIVARLEGGNLTLDQSLAWFQQGIKLAKQCGEMLDRAELQVRELSIGANGEPALTEFAAGD